MIKHVDNFFINLTYKKISFFTTFNSLMYYLILYLFIIYDLFATNYNYLYEYIIIFNFIYFLIVYNKRLPLGTLIDIGLKDIYHTENELKKFLFFFMVIFNFVTLVLIIYAVITLEDYRILKYLILNTLMLIGINLINKNRINEYKKELKDKYNIKH